MSVVLHIMALCRDFECVGRLAVRQVQECPGRAITGDMKNRSGNLLFPTVVAQQSYSEAQYFGAAAFTLVAGPASLYAGRHMRRTGRSPLFPTETFRSTDTLYPAPAPRRSNRLTGRVLEGLGWFMVVGCVVNLIGGIYHAF